MINTNRNNNTNDSLGPVTTRGLHFLCQILLCVFLFQLVSNHMTPLHHYNYYYTTTFIPTVYAVSFNGSSSVSQRYTKKNQQQLKNQRTVPKRIITEWTKTLVDDHKHDTATRQLFGMRGGGSHQQQQPKSRNVEGSKDHDNNKLSKNGKQVQLRGGETPQQLLILFRLLYITYYGSLGALMPYLPVYYDSLGHGGKVIGALGAVKPITTFVVGPLWGIASDYFQNPNGILELTFVTSFILQMLLPFTKTNVNHMICIVFLTAVFNAPVKSLIDSLVMNNLQEQSTDGSQQYGKLRLWGQLGFGLGSSIVGYLISTLSSSSSKISSATTSTNTVKDILSKFMKQLSNINGFEFAFVAYAIVSLPVFLCLQYFQRFDKAARTATIALKATKKKSASKSSVNIGQGLNLLFHNKDAKLFFTLVFLVGTASGIIENFAYVRVREVGGTSAQMGFCRFVSSMAGAPMFWFSSIITQHLGVDQVLVLSLFSFMIRFLDYAFMKHPYHALPAEALRGITFAAFWSSGTVYAHKISPQGMSTTMLMFMNAMYGGLGQSVGSIIGGYLQSKVGTVKTFVYSAIFDFGLICWFTIYLVLRRKDSNFRNPIPIGSTTITSSSRKKNK